MSDEPKLEAVPDEPVVAEYPYQVILQVGMTGDVNDQVQTKLLFKMNAVVDEMRELFPARVFEASITDYIMGTEARQV